MHHFVVSGQRRVFLKLNVVPLLFPMIISVHLSELTTGRNEHSSNIRIVGSLGIQLKSNLNWKSAENEEKCHLDIEGKQLKTDRRL